MVACYTACEDESAEMAYAPRDRASSFFTFDTTRAKTGEALSRSGHIHLVKMIARGWPQAGLALFIQAAASALVLLTMMTLIGALYTAIVLFVFAIISQGAHHFTTGGREAGHPFRWRRQHNAMVMVLAAVVAGGPVLVTILALQGLSLEATLPGGRRLAVSEVLPILWAGLVISALWAGFAQRHHLHTVFAIAGPVSLGLAVLPILAVPGLGLGLVTVLVVGFGIGTAGLIAMARAIAGRTGTDYPRTRMASANIVRLPERLSIRGPSKPERARRIA